MSIFFDGNSEGVQMLVTDSPPITYIPKPEWISVDERLPKEDGQYLTYSFDEETDDDMIVTAYFFKRLSNKKNRWVLDNDSGNYVTHWMPLPEPPKGE